MTDQAIYQAAIKHWGEDAQIRVSVEECGELITALMKYGRKVNGSSIEEIVGEIVDVEIMLGQLKEIFRADYEQIKNQKIMKVLDRLDKEYAKEELRNRMEKSGITVI